MEPKTGKRIVSKGAYVVISGFRVGLCFGRMGLLFSILCCGLLACIYLLRLLQGWFWDVSPMLLGLACMICCLSCYLCWKALKAIDRKIQQIEKIKPLTRANTADLPAPESLVRASAEPMQAQEGVLLRAAEERQERYEEQLLRASG